MQLTDPLTNSIRLHITTSPMHVYEGLAVEPPATAILLVGRGPVTYRCIGGVGGVGGIGDNFNENS
jgi:hypothetical protein